MPEYNTIYESEFEVASVPVKNACLIADYMYMHCPVLFIWTQRWNTIVHVQ